MALVAHPVGDRRVHIIEENRTPVGPVRVMAGRAAGICNRIIHVPIRKGGAVRFMAPQTKRRNVIREKER